ncbi:hypothetical protein SAMN05892883_2922 [Jatrophihabitans sp. GAS493]|nr:hypothetical protein SAMN05892883_2922 [Jatrophihabitans sp. GAS493]
MVGSIDAGSVARPRVLPPSCDRRPRPPDLPEVRVRQPAFDLALAHQGITSHQSMADAFGLDVEEISAAMRGAPVTPSFVATVTMTMPQHRFNELFELDLRHALR